MPLPTVSQETSGQFVRTLKQATGDQDQLDRDLDKIEQSNPHVARLIRATGEVARKPTEVMIGMVCVYLLLESQAKVDDAGKK